MRGTNLFWDECLEDNNGCVGPIYFGMNVLWTMIYSNILLVVTMHCNVCDHYIGNGINYNLTLTLTRIMIK